MSRLFNKTKIVATVGPASNTKEMLVQLMSAGVDVFRLNFSHGTHEDHEKVIKTVRGLNSKLDYNISILQDLQGPKIRIGEIKDGSFELEKEDELIITTKKIKGRKGIVSTSYKSITHDVKAGDTIMIDDGKIQVEVFEVNETEVHTRVIYGGTLRPKKGMNLPDTDISAPSLTKKDKKDLEFGLKAEVDWIAISFVRTAGDVIALKNIIKENGKVCKVIAKIERPEAITNIDAIIEASDAIMVARGDLGVEVLMEEVPIYQKMIVKKCNQAGKPVIIATQMMESMMDNPRPTRAEANDVANAVMDGADAVMLSGETAAGKYPIETIMSMDKIIGMVEREAESIYYKRYWLDDKNPNFTSNVIVDSACKIAQITHARAIVGMTSSGFTAFRLARHRPKAHIFIFTPSKHLLQTLNLLWGVRAFYYNKMESTDATFADIEKILIRNKHIRKGDVYINTASMPIASKLKTNVLKVNVVQ